MEAERIRSMRRSVTFFDSRRVLVLVILAGVTLIGGQTLGPPALAKVFMTQDEALKLAFPGQTDIKRQTAYLTDDQAAAVEKLTGEKPPSRVITWYVGRGGGEAKGAGVTAWFDSHVVRTLPETIMVVVTSSGTIERIDILSFSEPEEYLPRAKWFDQLKGHPLNDELSLRRGVRPITGATLSARAIVTAARRVLALRQLLESPPPKTPPTPQGGKP